MRPRALDLFCGAGGASMGLHRAGFDVVGIDHKPQPRYPFRFIQADALRPPVDLSAFDFIWASPPCQAFTALRNLPGVRPAPDLIRDMRTMLVACGVPYAIENVVGSPLRSTFRLCGSMFGLQTPCGAELRRHRHFETSFIVLTPPCTCGRSARTITITGRTPQQNVVRNKVRQTFTVDDARAAMGAPWMTMAGLSQAIPPAYSEFIGRAALDQLRAAA